LKFGKAAKNIGAKIISITDSHLSPISNLGDVTFHIHVGIPSYVDAYAAPITFINALCAEIAERMSAKTAASLDHYDRFVEEFNLFFKPVKRGR
jgi:DNA-binding MurR/RpiR family transcriptional regulator